MSNLDGLARWAAGITKSDSPGVLKMAHKRKPVAAGSGTPASGKSKSKPKEKAGGKPRGDGKTAPDGFTPIPGSKHNGYHKRVGDKWVSWYPSSGTGPHAKENLTNEQHAAAYDSVDPKSRKLLDGMRNNTVRRYEPDAKPEKQGKPKKPKKEHPHKGKIDQVAEFKPNRPIPPTAQNVEIRFDPKRPETAHTGPLMTWVNEKGVVERAYSAEFDRRQARAKWSRLAEMVPRVATAVRSLRTAMSNGNKRERDASVALALMEDTGLRPGSRAAALRGGGAATTGVTTLKPEHVTFIGDTAHINFIGKASKPNHRVISDPELVAELRKRVENPAADGFLFTCNEKDSSAMMKRYFGKFKQKDLRTLQGSMRAADLLAAEPPIQITANKTKDLKAIQEVINRVSKTVSEYLDNTLPMARESYIHPSLFVEWMVQNGIGPEYTAALFKGRVLSATRNMTPGGASLLLAALKRGKGMEDKAIPYEGDTDFESEIETYPLSFKGF